MVMTVVSVVVNLPAEQLNALVTKRIRRVTCFVTLNLVHAAKINNS